MRKMLLSTALGLLSLSALNAQTTKDSSLQISGSGDIYYRYDFAQGALNPTANPDALGTKQNSVDFGMLDLKIQKDLGKTSIFSELAFGPRASSTIDNSLVAYYLQNLYFSYKIIDKLTASAGIMYRYDTYEKLTAADNFNYLASNSFLESRKVPSRSVGVKAKYAFSDKVNLTVGLFNSIDAANINANDAVTSSPSYGLSDVVAQLEVKPIKHLKLSAAIWNEGKKSKGTHTNFQAKYKMSHGIHLGLDVTNYSGSDSLAQATNNFNNFTSVAFYAQKTICSGFALGLRYENEMVKQNSVSGTYVNENYNIFTLTGKEKFGALSFKQEVKYDMTDNSNVNTPYMDKNGIATNKDVQFVVAAVFSF